MAVLEESKYPHIYAVAYILNHGEGKINPLRDPELLESVTADLDRRLAALTFAEIVEYTLCDESKSKTMADAWKFLELADEGMAWHGLSNR